MLGSDAVAVTVIGGEKGEPLPSSRAFDGTPDPEIARAVAEGQTRYHLETLEVLDREARSATVLDAGASTNMNLDPGAARTLFDRLRARTREPAVAPCRTAGCRTLDACLCTCRACRVACASRKQPARRSAR